MSASPVPFSLPFSHYAHLGYYPVPLEGKRPIGGKGWHTKRYTDEELAAFDARGHNVGLVCENIVGLDIDLTEEEHARKVERVIRKVLSLPKSTPRRVGRAPKCLLIMRVDAPMLGYDIRHARRSVLFQLLGAGKQFVVHGIHPDTRAPYTLNRPLPHVAKLPVLTPEKATELRDALVEVLGQLGYAVDASAFKGGKGAGQFTEPNRPWAASEMEQAWQALCQLDPDMVRADWIKVGMALHDGTHGSAEGFELWDNWSSETVLPGYDGKSKYKPHSMLNDWRNFKPGKGTTRATLFKNDFAKRTVAASTAVPKQESGGEQQEGEEFGPFIDWTTLKTNPPKPKRALLEDWLYAGTVGLFAGDGGTGKSFLGLQLAVHLALGESFLGRTVVQEQVLYYSCEDDADTVKYRAMRICKALGRAHEELDGWLVIRDLTRSNAIMYVDPRTGVKPLAMQVFKDDIVAMSPTLAIIDNASDTFDGNEIVRAQVRAFVRQLQAAAKDCAVLLLAHVDKASAKNPETGAGYSGSTAWNNSVRSRWYLYRNDDKSTLTLELQKSNYGKSGEQFIVKYEELKGVFALEAAAQKAATMEFKVLRTLVEIVAHGGYLPISDRANRNVRKQLEEKGIVLSKAECARITTMLAQKGMLNAGAMRTQQRKEIEVWEPTESALKLVESARK